MKLFLDDERSAPEGWVLVRTSYEMIKMLRTHLDITEISLDHDLGTDPVTGYSVLLWIEKQVVEDNYNPPVIHIHTANSSARTRMELAVKSIERFKYGEVHST